MPVKIKRLISTIILIALICTIGYFSYKYVIIPSYLSVSWSCRNVTVEELQEVGYTVNAKFSSSSEKITTYQRIVDPRIIKHETCHYYQNVNGKLCDCDKPLGLFFNEVECNIRMWF